MAGVPIYKLILVGEGEVGKTTWLRKLRTGEFENVYVPTLGVEVHGITISTNEGDIRFNIWDCSGVEAYRGLGSGYYINGDCAIVMGDLFNPLSMEKIPEWIEEVKSVIPNAPLVVVGTKSDLVGNVNLEDTIKISTMDEDDIYSPLLALARMLEGNMNLSLVG